MKEAKITRWKVREDMREESDTEKEIDPTTQASHESFRKNARAEQIFEGIMYEVFLTSETIWYIEKGHTVAPGSENSQTKQILVKLLDFREIHLAVRQNDQVTQKERNGYLTLSVFIVMIDTRRQ